MSEHLKRLPSHQRFHRMHGRLGPGEQEREAERRFSPAINTYERFPEGFTPADEVALAPTENKVSRAYTEVLSAATPFLPYAIRLNESPNTFVNFYIAPHQQVLQIDTDDLLEDNGVAPSRVIFPKVLGEKDINYIAFNWNGVIEPIDEYTTGGRYNYAPYRVGHRIWYLNKHVIPHLDPDAYTYPDYITAINNFWRYIDQYKAAVEDIASDKVPHIQEATGVFVQQLVDAAHINRKAMPRTAEISFADQVTFSLDLKTLALTRYKRRQFADDEEIEDRYAFFAKDESVPARPATPVEWCIVAPYIKDEILDELELRGLLSNRDTKRFGTDLSSVNAARYVGLPLLWRE